MAQVVYDSTKPLDGYVDRKSVDTSGRLGSLYDAFTDNIVTLQSAQPSETKSSSEPDICRIFSGDQSNAVIKYLKRMDFNDVMIQSICFGLVTPSGVSSLINYNQSINENTRLLYYSYRSKEEELRLTPEKVHQIISSLPSSVRATHIITKIVWGFEILCVISIPDYRFCDTIHSLLQSISNRLQSSANDLVLTDNEKRQINELVNVTVYGSETCVGNSNIPLLSVLSMLKDWQKTDNFHHPLKYTMCSLRWLCNNNQFSEFFDLSDKTNSDITKVQPTITWLDNWAKYFQWWCKTLPEIFPGPIQNQALKDIQQHLNIWLSTYSDFRKHLQEVLVGIRQRRCESTVLQDVMSSQQYSLFKRNEIEAFNGTIQQSLTKEMLIKRLNEDQIQYINVRDFCILKRISMTFGDIDAAFQRTSVEENSYLFIWYSSERLKYQDPSRWEQFYQRLVCERKQSTEKTILVYADFSQCEQQLKDFTVVRLPIQLTSGPLPAHFRDFNQPLLSTLYPELQQLSQQVLPTLSPPSQQSSPPAITEINVLLLGETGVGKSTFINAFVNYLIFDTLQQAEQSDPVVLIPVSFLVTIGDQFDEFIVKFGDVDTNEDHEHQGQSVTQQCKSYVFHLNDRLILRLIDTPGIGDTRGVAQDDKNIDHILTYINNLSHLNAVCLLLKPNASRLNVFFRSCVNQLFTYLTPISYDNIIFCFTNARATFFAPGDTGPLLRQMLKKEHDNIPFQKTNTFCFDSESFRYLAAKKRGVNFDDFQTQECISSWTTSVTESVRLLKYILTRQPYDLQGYQSLRKAALAITMLARPLMETLRLIIYNWQLCEAKMTNKRIILTANPVNSEFCSSCVLSRVVPVGPFFVIQYQCVPSKINGTQRHQCSSDNKSLLFEFIVNYNFVAESQNHTKEQLRDLLDDLLFKYDQLTHFLRQQRLSPRDDPFTLVLERFLEEEQWIADSSHINSDMNRGVREILSSIKEKRLKNSIQLNESKKSLTLDDVYRIIDELKTFETMEKQINSMMESRQLRMKAYEYLVKTNSVKNKIFTELTNSFQ